MRWTRITPWLCLTIMLPMECLAAESDMQCWVVSPHARVRREDHPGNTSTPGILSLATSRNGFISGQIAVRAGAPIRKLQVQISDLKAKGDAIIPARAVQVRFVGYVEVKPSIGRDDARPNPSGQLPDPLLEDPPPVVEAEQTQPVWLTFNVPKDVPPGTYQGDVRISAGGKAVAQIPVELAVDGLTLPDTRDYRFYLDLWQQPDNIADQSGVQRWSEQHWSLIRVYLAELARAGQKVITTTIIKDPWGGQTEVPYDTLVRWIGDGRSFRHDYARFDRYVSLCMDLGIDRTIAAYSMVLGPGKRSDCVIAYEDAKTGEAKSLRMQVGDEVYRTVWTEFLKDFKAHLQAKGWLDRTQLAFDEKPEQIMNAVMDVVRATVPDFRIGLSVYTEGDHAKLSAGIQNYNLIWPGVDPKIADQRRAAGRVTTFYTCVGPAYPNTFAFSPLSEAQLLPWHAAACHADGYLRWAWNSWPKDPLTSPDYDKHKWPSGDTFLIYPGKRGPISSLRWEMLKQGVQDFELVTMARERLARRPDAALAATVEQSIALAVRNPDGRRKDPADLPAARAMLVQALLR